MTASPRLSVIHLVRSGNPKAFLERFVRSYLKYDSGFPHDLVFILKGFSEVAEREAECNILKRLSHAHFLAIDDDGYDINAYRMAAEQLHSPLLFFTNSYSRFEDSGWAQKLLRPLDDDPTAGVVGASASWEVLCPDTPFPNPHIRTNAFAVRREDFLSIDFGPLDTKWACREFEAGENSMTRQYLERGLRPLIVGKNGVAYRLEDWPEADVFRWGRQSNLLISDNQTRAYFETSFYWRRKQSRVSWQARANPFRTSVLEKGIRFFWGSAWRGVRKSLKKFRKG